MKWKEDGNWCSFSLAFSLTFSDSGMSVSFQSGSAGSAGTVSQESSPQQHQLGHAHQLGHTHQLGHAHQLHQHQARARKVNTSASHHTGQSTQL